MVRGRNPGEDIVDIADRYQVDEIIIGTDRTSRIEKFEPGRYIRHVLEMASCPVVIT